MIYQIKFGASEKVFFSKKGLILILFLVLITIVRVQVLANLLVAVVILLLSFLGKRRSGAFFFIFSSVAIVFLIIPVSFYADFLFDISTYFDSDSVMYYKIRDLALYIQYSGTSSSIVTGASLRAERYPMLFEAFVASPLRGDSSYNSIFTHSVAVGGHLYWMNKLTIWGLPGFLFFIFILFRLFKSINSLFDRRFRYYYFLCVEAFIFLGLIKHVGGREPFLMLIVIIPGLYFLTHLEQKGMGRPNKIRYK